MLSRKLVVLASLLGLCILGGTALTLSSVLGSSHFVFTGINCVLMLLGSLFGALPAAGIIAAFFAIKAIAWSLPITAGIPTLLSAIGFASYAQPRSLRSGLLLIGYPALCMLLFIVHPVGGSAAAYSLYWIIPSACYVAHLCGFNSVLLAALGSTFIAHATGSVMWLYLRPTTPDLWLSLIPLVFVERLVFALAATVCYSALKKVTPLMLRHSTMKNVRLFFQ